MDADEIEIDIDEPEDIPTLAEHMDRYERAFLDGQTSIGPQEAERRYYERYPEDDYWRDRG